MNRSKKLLHILLFYLAIPYTISFVIAEATNIYFLQNTQLTFPSSPNSSSIYNTMIPPDGFLRVNPMSLASAPRSAATASNSEEASLRTQTLAEAAPPPQKIPITLLGIIWQAPPKESFFFAEHGGVIGYYRTGDSIDGQQVELITPQNVHFAGGLVLEPFEDKVDQSVAQGAATGQQVTFNRGRAQIELAEARAMISNPNLLMSKVAIHPSNAGGYFVNWVDRRSVFGAVLQKGDIIKRVNGVEVTTPRDLFLILESLDKRNFFSIDIEREKQRQTVVIEVKR